MKFDQSFILRSLTNLIVSVRSGHIIETNEMKPRSRYRGLTIFVTVGSTRFDKLINQMLTEDRANQLTNLGFARLILQIGKSDYDFKQVASLKKNYSLDIEIYEYKSSILNDIEIADVVVGHAGAGTCLEVLRMSKRLLIVVNDTLMDNHQCELAEQLSKENYAIQTTVDELGNSLDIICDSSTKLDKFPPKDFSEFKQIFNEALKKVTLRL